MPGKSAALGTSLAVIALTATQAKAAAASDATMQHEFTCVDGSTIETTESTVQTPVFGGDEATLTVVHTVIASRGRFAGGRGTFTSFGVHNTKTGKGVQRFEGTLS
jgi:membrane-bound inhibitor of C-type lysozyme